MKNLILISNILLVVFFITVKPANIKAQLTDNGKVFTVNNTGDSVDANPGDLVCADADGNCTLRAAIEEANATLIFDIIIFSLPNPSIINLTLGELLTHLTRRIELDSFLLRSLKLIAER